MKLELFRSWIFVIIMSHLVCESSEGENIFLSTYRILRKEDNHSGYNLGANEENLLTN